MRQATKKLLEEFDALSDRERSEPIAELTRRIGQARHDGPPDEDLLAATDRLFLDLDKREQS